MIVVDTLLLVPRNIGLAILMLYRRWISPLYGDVCRYYPSCSAYTLGSIQQRGLLLGSLRGGIRILRCNPWAAGGIDDVPPKKHFRYTTTTRGFVVASTQRKG